MIKTTDLLTHWGPADKMIASEFGLVTEAEWSELERAGYGPAAERCAR